MVRRAGLTLLAAAMLGGSAVPFDVSAPLALKDPRRCEFQPTGEKLLKAMLHQAGEGSAMAANSRAKLGRWGLAIDFEEARDPATRFVTYRSRLELPAGTSWNGLGLVSIAVEEFVPPEIDGLSARELYFIDPPERVRERFRRLGVRFPEGGGDAFIDKPLGGCEGSIRIERNGGRTMLRCEWGC